MTAFVVAYSIVWLAVFGYLLRFDARQRQLSKTLESLQARLDHGEREA